MSLFFDLLSSINNPNQQGSVTQLESITSNLQNIASTQGLDASQMGAIMTAVGGQLGPLMQQQATQGGLGPLQGMLGQLAGGNAAAFQSMLTPQLQQQLVQGVSQATGISPNALQGMLPTLLASAMGLLSMGAGKSEGGTNPLLTAFLDGGKGNDLGTVLNFANRFLNAPHS